jgi:hypothetical protein
LEYKIPTWQRVRGKKNDSTAAVTCTVGVISHLGGYWVNSITLPKTIYSKFKKIEIFSVRIKRTRDNQNKTLLKP